MAEILHQLIDSLSHYLQGLYISGGAGYQPSTVASACLREILERHWEEVVASSSFNCLVLEDQNLHCSFGLLARTPRKFIVAPQRLPSHQERSLPTTIFQGLC